MKILQWFKEKKKQKYKNKKIFIIKLDIILTIILIQKKQE